MKCKECGKEFGVTTLIERVTFSTSTKTTESVLGAYLSKTGKVILDLDKPYLEHFDLEVIYQCGYCHHNYNEREVIEIVGGLNEM